MHKNYNLITNVPFVKATGPIDFNLTNDYMFKATLQECEEARRGLISALLSVDPSEIETEVTNPIELGKSIGSKDFFLDVKVIVNKVKTMNLEMQVKKELAWNERLLSYGCRSFDKLKIGEDYLSTSAFHQVGFICFDMFPEHNRFYDTFYLQNEDNTQIYSDKFVLSVVNLRRIDEATERDKLYKLDKWCKLITASSWEEAKLIAKEDPLMEATIEQLYNLGADIDVIEEAIRRKDYYDYVHSLENKITEKDSEIAEKDSMLKKKAAEIAEKNFMLKKNAAEIAELKKQLNPLRHS